MGNLTDWQVVGPLGEGGQSKVSLVRSPGRVNERAQAMRGIRRLGHEQDLLLGDLAGHVATSVWSYARADLPSELGALKRFNIRPEGQGLAPVPGSPEDEAVQRLKNEISVLRQGRPGLPRLLDSNEAERWIVTEYFDRGTLENNPNEYRGQPARALMAFRGLVSTVASLHAASYVHRDIKPPNIFLSSPGRDPQLVLGDFGIVYSPDLQNRITRTGEKVGPRDYMPPWAHRGKRIESVETNWDVYMLGKLLWCMVDGRSFLPREYFREPEFDLTKNFPHDPDMYVIESILTKCLVERPSDCLSSATLLLADVDVALKVLERGGQIVSKDVPRFCRVCGKGVYEGPLTGEREAVISLYFTGAGSERTAIRVRPYACTVCGHIQLFRPV